MLFIAASLIAFSALVIGFFGAKYRDEHWVLFGVIIAICSVSVSILALALR
jgi:hypothetical protein